MQQRRRFGSWGWFLCLGVVGCAGGVVASIVSGLSGSAGALIPVAFSGNTVDQPALLFAYAARAEAVTFDETRGVAYAFDKLHESLNTIDVVRQRVLRVDPLPSAWAPYVCPKRGKFFAVEKLGPKDQMRVYTLSTGVEQTPPITLFGLVSKVVVTPDEKQFAVIFSNSTSIGIYDATTHYQVTVFDYAGPLANQIGAPTNLFIAAEGGSTYAVYGVHGSQLSRTRFLAHATGTLDDFLDFAQFEIPSLKSGASEKTNGVEQVAFEMAKSGVKRVFVAGVMLDDPNPQDPTDDVVTARLAVLDGDLGAIEAETQWTIEPREPDSFADPVVQRVTAMLFEPRSRALLLARLHPTQVAYTGPTSSPNTVGRVDIVRIAKTGAPSAPTTVELPGTVSALAVDGANEQAFVALGSRLPGLEPTLVRISDYSKTVVSEPLTFGGASAGNDAVALAIGGSELVVAEIDQLRLLNLDSRATITTTPIRGPGPFRAIAVGPNVVDHVFASMTNQDVLAAVPVSATPTALTAGAVARFGVAGRPFALHHSRDSQGKGRLYVAAPGAYGQRSSSVWWLDSDTPSAPLEIPGLNGPAQCVVSSDDKQLFVANYGLHLDDPTSSFLDAELASVVLPSGVPLVIGNEQLWGITRIVRIDTPSPESLFLATSWNQSATGGSGGLLASFVDTPFTLPTASIASTNDHGVNVVVDKSKHFAYVVEEVGGGYSTVEVFDIATAVATLDPSAVTSVDSFSSFGPWRLFAAVADPETDDVYVAGYNDGRVHALRYVQGTGVIDNPFGTGRTPVDMSIVFVGSGAVPHLCVANYSEGVVRAYDLATKSLKATIAVGGGPIDLALDASNNWLFVANSLDGTLSVIRVDDLALSAPQVFDTIDLLGP